MLIIENIEIDKILRKFCWLELFKLYFIYWLKVNVVGEFDRNFFCINVLSIGNNRYLE